MLPRSLKCSRCDGRARFERGEETRLEVGRKPRGPVAELVGIEGGVVSGVFTSGFQSGIISSQNLAQVNKLKPTSCIPYNVTEDQAKLIIEKFLRDNPRYMQLSAAMVAAYALLIAFPCP
jgi:hypothetical protein